MNVLWDMIERERARNERLKRMYASGCLPSEEVILSVGVDNIHRVYENVVGLKTRVELELLQSNSYLANLLLNYGEYCRNEGIEPELSFESLEQNVVAYRVENNRLAEGMVKTVKESSRKH